MRVDLCRHASSLWSHHHVKQSHFAWQIFHAAKTIENQWLLQLPTHAFSKVTLVWMVIVKVGIYATAL
jgi:hypothetical protein